MSIDCQIYVKVFFPLRVKINSHFHNVSSWFQIELLLGCPSIRLEARQFLNVISVQNSKLNSCCGIIIAILQLIFKRSFRSFVNLERILSLFLNLNLEVAALFLLVFVGLVKV